MKISLTRIISGLLVITVLPVVAATRYVDLNNAVPAFPYTNWGTAASNIQDAVDAAQPGDLVLVTNGLYATGARSIHPYQAPCRVAVLKPITVQSVNGPGFTIIQGYQEPGFIFGTNAVRCVYLTNDAMLSGFTLTNGSTRDLVYQDSGGGVRCESASSVVSNCVLVGNAANYLGGGAYRGTLVDCTLKLNTAPDGGGGYGGGASTAVLTRCLVISNSAVNGGGGVVNGVLNDCSVIGNFGAEGGGVSGSSLTNCTLTGNRAVLGGGSYSSTVVGSMISSNSASDRGGGAFAGQVYNSSLIGNVAANGGGMAVGVMQACVVAGNAAVSTNGVSLNFSTFGGGLYQVNATNCTITGNSAIGGGGGAATCVLANCILYHNFSAKYAGVDNYSGGSLDYCCTAPMPASGVGNFVTEPLLLNASVIHADSPCRAAGSNFIGGFDIDGQAWANPPSVGCDEYYPGGFTGSLSVAIKAETVQVGRTYPVNLSAWIVGRPSAIRWDFGDGTVVSNRAFVSYSWQVAGVYSVVLTAFNDSNPGGIQSTAQVQVVDQVHYVRANSSMPVPPYLTWATAATNIQNAIDAASVTGALVLVSNGVYATGGRVLAGFISNRVAVTKPLIIQSVNGPAVTTIYGSFTPAVRGVYLTNGAVLRGFTITEGGTSTGGDSRYDQMGAGVYCESAHAIITDCIIRDCRSRYQGGAVSYGVLDRCVLFNNSAPFYGGGAYGSAVNNSLIYSNSSSIGGGAFQARITNCTVVANRCSGDGAGVYGGVVQNSIVYSNLYSGVVSNYAQANLGYSCTTPLPPGVGNFTNQPLFVNQITYDFRLRTNSPCINSGWNLGAAGSDLDGSLRIAGGTVDVGAYEFQSPSSVLSYAWAQSFGLPTDGSADFSDADADHLNNYAEWRADTIPTNASSVFRMVSATNGSSGANVIWQSVSTRNYWLERATNFGVNSPFHMIATNIVGMAGSSTFIDTTATNSGPYFYRAGVD